MKRKLSLAFCALMFLAGFFGLQAVSESALPFWKGVGSIAVILAVLFLVAGIANKQVEEDAR